jgi:hypothetical protein
LFYQIIIIRIVFQPHLSSPSRPKPVPLTQGIRTIPMKLVHRSRKQDDDEDSDDDSEWLTTQRYVALTLSKCRRERRIFLNMAD